MQKFFSQKLDMQIPQERPPVSKEAGTFTAEIEKDYTIHRKEEVTSFIGQHPEIIPYIKK